jgi:hypothetical protein
VIVCQSANGKNYAGFPSVGAQTACVKASRTDSPNAPNTSSRNLRFVATKATNRALGSFKLLVNEMTVFIWK